MFLDVNPVVSDASLFFVTPIRMKLTPMEFLYFFSDATPLSISKPVTPEYPFLTPVGSKFSIFDATLTPFLSPQILRCRRVYRGVRAVSSILVSAENP